MERETVRDQVRRIAEEARAAIASNKRNVAAMRNGSSDVAKPNAISGPAFSSPYG